MARKPIPVGWSLVAEVQPKSDWDALPYRVCRETTGTAWRCDCKGFIFGTSKTPDGDKTCKHIKAAQRELTLWTSAQAPAVVKPKATPILVAKAVPMTEVGSTIAQLTTQHYKNTLAAKTLTPRHMRVTAMLKAIGLSYHGTGQFAAVLNTAHLDTLETYLAHLTPVAEITEPVKSALPERAFHFCEE